MEPTTSTSLPWTDILVALTALYAAVLSTYTFVNDWKKGRPRLKVTTGWGMPVYGASLGDEMVVVTAMNTGFLPVTIASVGMLLPDGKTNQLINVPSEFSLPHELQPGRSCTFYIDQDAVSTELYRNGYRGAVRFRAYCSSQIGQQFKSNEYKLSL